MMNTYKSFGKWVRERRRMRGLNQEQLAKKISYSVSGLRKVEADERRPSHQVATRLAAELGITEDEQAAFLHLALLRGSAQGEPSEVVPTPGVPRLPGFLPEPPTPILGREAKVIEIIDKMEQPEVRLLTLIGPPGVGKTRLALEVARRVRGRYAGGTWLVELAPLRDASQVGSTIARTLGVRDPGNETLLEAIAAFVGDKRVLLLLDNFEHVGSANILVADLLVQCPQLSVLVTSRTALTLRSEHLFDVSPLDQPANAADLVSVARAPATALFIQRVAAVAPHFTLTRGNAEAIVTICKRLDGLPLAIELAASRGGILTPQELLTRLPRRLALLHKAPGDMPIHQRTLRGAIDWSYNLLPPEAQTVFDQIGVFDGGWTHEAAEAVVRFDDQDHDVILNIHDTLVGNSLIVRRVNDNQTRFVLLETLREYALEQLDRQGITSAVRERHAAYYVKYAEALKPELQGPDRTRLMKHLDADIDNIRAAINWSFAHEGGDAATRIIGALHPFWSARGHYRMANEWRTNLQRDDATHRASPHALARALHSVGFLVAQQGTVEVVPLFRWSLALFEAVGDLHGQADVLCSLGMIARYPGNYLKTHSLLTASLAAATKAKATDAIARANYQLGFLHFEHRMFSIAEQQLIYALNLFQHAGNELYVTRARALLGHLAYAQGDIAEAQRRYTKLMSLEQTHLDREILAGLYSGLGDIATYTGDHSLATHYYECGVDLFRAVNREPGITIIRISQGFRTLHDGDFENATTIFGECERSTAHTLNLAGFAHSLVALAWIDLHLNRPEQAVLRLGAATTLRQHLNLAPHPLEGDIFDRAANTARAELGEARFDRIVKEAETAMRNRLTCIACDTAFEAIASLRLWDFIPLLSTKT